MSKFHVNPTTGVTGPCTASKGRCPHGGEEFHGASPQEAEAKFAEYIAQDSDPETNAFGTFKKTQAGVRQAANTISNGSAALRQKYSSMEDGTRIERGPNGSIPIPAGTYYLMPTTDLSLSGSGPMGLGTVSKPYGEEYSESQQDLLQRLSQQVDSHQEEPKPGQVQGVVFEGEPVIFVGDPNMGNNHNGWRDGVLLVGEGLKGKLEAAGFNLASEDTLEFGLHEFSLEDLSSVEEVDPEDYFAHSDALYEEDQWSVGVKINGRYLDSKTLRAH